MNKNFKKNIIWGCALATAFVLSACDDSSSNPKSDNDNPSSSSSNQKKNDSSSSSISNGTGDNSDSLPAGFEDGIKIDFNLTVDKAAKTFSMTPSDQAGMACVMEQEKIKWKSVSKDPLAQTLKYDFVGDTLVMYNWDSDDQKFETIGSMYVGGTAGTLNGSWRYTPCLYNSEKGKSECRDDEDYKSFDAIAIFATNSLTIMQKNGTSEFDYLKTEFREYLFSSIEDDDAEMLPSAFELFYKTKSEETFENIEVLKQTKRGETFKYNGTIYTVNIPTIQNNGIRRSATAEIASAEKTCTNSYEATTLITKELCIDDNIDDLEFDTEKDENGKTFRYAMYFEKDNYKEFENCVTDLFGLSTGEIYYNDYAPLSKKAAKKKHSTNIFKNPF